MYDRPFAILLLLGAFVASLINERLPSLEQCGHRKLTR